MRGAACAPLAVRTIATAAELGDAFDVRRRVFIEEQDVPEADEFDEDDRRAIHALAVTGGVPVGTGRLLLDDGAGRIGRMAVLAEYRRRSVGRRILEHLIELAARHGCKRVVLHAQLHALPFYERSGFRAHGEPFDEVGIPHRRMELLLSQNGSGSTAP